MQLKTRLLASTLFVNVALISAPALAQQADADSEEQVSITDSDADAKEGGQIVVTGSRIRQDAFNSPTPIQVLDAEEAKKIGISTATELLQRATVASGNQIDATINTNSGNSNASEAPPTGGAGSSNIDLRGLGIERTLVMVNGRRLGSSGVRGAPSQPDISLLPLGMIERIDVVTEGASSIYGADAVAGVVNVILKTEFEGLELNGALQNPEHSGGDVQQFSAIMGASDDRGRIMVGAEYYHRSRISAFQRAFTRDGLIRREFDEEGNEFILSRNGFFDNVLQDLSASTPGGNQFFFYTPGQSDTGVPNFSSFNNLPPVPPNARLRTGAAAFANFVYFDFYNDNTERTLNDLVQPLERYSFVTTGSYDLDQDSNMQAYFEGYYFERKQFIKASIEQIFPDIPAEIAEVDDSGRVIGYVDNPLNPFDFNVVPIITLEDNPQNFNVDVQQIRAVAGIRGDIPGQWFEDHNWNYDVTWSFDRGTGFQSQQILFEPHLLNVTQGVFQRPDGSLGCGLQDLAQEGGFFTIPECPIVNFFADSFYVGGPNGDGAFENDAQRAYLLGNRTNRTVMEQTIYSAFLTGDLFDIPFGDTVAFAIGYEHRDDVIDSQNDLVGVLGLNAAENPLVEGETRGARNLDEVYGELQIPLIVGKPFAELLQVDGAIRYTDESNFGGQETYRIRGLWRPIEWIQLSGSYGTSYRAPNLREQFLANQGGGISGAADPCINANVQAAITNAGGDNQPTVVNRINNCILDGVIFTDTDGNGFADTTVLGTAGITTIPTSTGGNAQLQPETSRSYTATLSMSPPISSVFDLDLAASYYDISIKNAVNNIDATSVINRCYNDANFPDLTSPFCSFIDRNIISPINSLIKNVQAGFINIGQENVRGLDFNSRIQGNLADIFGGSDIDFILAVSATRQLERKRKVFEDDPLTDFLGTFGFPKWKGQGNFGLDFGSVEVQTQVNYLGPQESFCVRNGTCDFNLNVYWVNDDGTRPISREVASAGSWWYQDFSVTFTATESATFTVGVKNLWDKEPPLVDYTIGNNRNGAVSSSGYDFIGRSFFINAGFRL